MGTQSMTSWLGRWSGLGLTGGRPGLGLTGVVKHAGLIRLVKQSGKRKGARTNDPLVTGSYDPWTNENEIMMECVQNHI